jgi:hypothetical protein
MAINVNCPNCGSDCSLRSKRCKKFGHRFESGRKYRVIVRSSDGKRVSKILESISAAKKFEAKLNTQAGHCLNQNGLQLGNGQMNGIFISFNCSAICGVM